MLKVAAHLHRYTEIVSELTELPIEKMSVGDTKESIINNTRVVEKFLTNLLQGCDEGLDEIGKGAIAMPGAGGAEEPGLQAAISASLAVGTKK